MVTSLDIIPGHVTTENMSPFMIALCGLSSEVTSNEAGDLDFTALM